MTTVVYTLRYGLVFADFWFVDGLVDLLYDPDELATVDSLHECIAHVSSSRRAVQREKCNQCGSWRRKK